MNNILGSLNANTVIQGLIALSATVGTFVLILNRIEIPTVVLVLDGAIVAYYFTNMTTVNTTHAVINKLNGDTKELQ